MSPIPFRGALAVVFLLAVSTAPCAIGEQPMLLRRNIVAVSPILLPLYANLRYWYFVDSAIAVGVGVHVPWAAFGEKAVAGYGSWIEPRVYLDRATSFEWYLASSICFGFVSHEDTVNAPYALLVTGGADVYTDDSRHLNIGLALSAGYIWNVTHIAAYRGANYSADVYTSNGMIYPVSDNQLIYAARVDLGWAW
jgi:hypothetical protein